MTEGVASRLQVTRLPGALQVKIWNDAVRFHQDLERKSQVPIDLSLTDNRHAMLTVRDQGAGWSMRAHHMFVHADNLTLDAIVTLGRPQNEAHANLARGVIRRFATERAHHIRLKTPRRRFRVRTQGQVHDLEALYQQVLEELRQPDPGLAISWGRWGRTHPTQRHVRLGSYDRARRLIRIHPLLDQEQVPDWVIRFVLFHELLHHLIPATRHQGRVIHHGEQFRRAEASHPDHDRYHTWTRDTLWKLLAAAQQIDIP